MEGGSSYGIGGPLAELFYLRDYWHPQALLDYPFGIEAVLFGFFFGGISSVIYEELFGKRFMRRISRDEHWSFFAMPFVLIVYLTMSILNRHLGLNSIYASMIAFLLIAFIMIFYRRDLFFDSLASGLAMGTIFFLGYMVFLSLFPSAIREWWMLKNISGFLVFGVPIEELLWAFCWGMVGGPLYEFLAGKKLVKTKN